MMTRQDYEKIVDLIVDYTKLERQHNLRKIDHNILISLFCDLLIKDNERFNREKFEKAVSDKLKDMFVKFMSL